MRMIDTELGPELPKQKYMSSTYSAYRAELFKEMEASAKALVEAALQRGEISRSFPPIDGGWTRESPERNAWFEACFDLTERELIDAHNAAIAVYRANKPTWRNWWSGERSRARKQAYRDYVRLHTMLQAGTGLTTVWR